LKDDLKEPEENDVPFPAPAQQRSQPRKRKDGRNRNKKGSVRNINGQVWVDFYYLNERVRENSGLPWNDQNAKEVRDQLDSIVVAIRNMTFRFGVVFPHSRKRAKFEELERVAFVLNLSPDQVTFGEYGSKWYELFCETGRVTGRTLYGYKGYLKHYLIPFFEEKTFRQLNATVFEEFVAWAKNQKLKGESVSLKSIKKYLTLMKRICLDASIKYGWGSAYNPFFGFRPLEDDSHVKMTKRVNEREEDEEDEDEVFPFNVVEIGRLRQELPDHWKPYFDFAFSAGLRPGEQIALKLKDINWENGILKVRRAITLDVNGKSIEGATKNEFSRREIALTPAMFDALTAQKMIYDQFGCKYFFCTPTGFPVHLSNLRRTDWIPALERAKIQMRAIKQTRHTFASIALASGEDPNWIAKVMGHANTQMVFKYYAKYVKNATGAVNGQKLNDILQRVNGKQE
jgi:integrase